MEGGLLYTHTEQPNTFKMISETPTGLMKTFNPISETPTGLIVRGGV